MNQLAKAIVDVATGEAEDSARERGRPGGLQGGRRRAEKLTPEQRRAIAIKAAAKRWSND
jgi:hypothetical protein